MKVDWKEMETWLTKKKTISHKESCLMIAVAFLLGLVLGMFLSPKKNVTIGSNNGSNNIGVSDDVFEEETSQTSKCC